MSDPLDLRGKVALITGGAQGQGAAEDAGVVHQRVEPAVTGDDVGDDRAPLLVRAHVEVDVVAADLRGELLARAVDDVGQHH